MLYFLNRALVAGYAALERLFVLVNGLTLTLPVALVAHDVLQVLVALYVFRAHDVRCVLDDLLGDARLAGYLDGKAGAWLSDAQLEQGLHLMTVVEHGAVDDALVVVGKMLQVLVVGSDDAKRLLLPELLQHRLGYRTADGRLSTAAKLVNQQQRTLVGLTHHLLHVHQV